MKTLIENLLDKDNQSWTAIQTDEGAIRFQNNANNALVETGAFRLNPSQKIPFYFEGISNELFVYEALPDPDAKAVKLKRQKWNVQTKSRDQDVVVLTAKDLKKDEPDPVILIMQKIMRAMPAGLIKPGSQDNPKIPAGPGPVALPPGGPALDDISININPKPEPKPKPAAQVKAAPPPPVQKQGPINEASPPVGAAPPEVAVPVKEELIAVELIGKGCVSGSDTVVDLVLCKNLTTSKFIVVMGSTPIILNPYTLFVSDKQTMYLNVGPYMVEKTECVNGKIKKSVLSIFSDNWVETAAPNIETYPAKIQDWIKKSVPGQALLAPEQPQGPNLGEEPQPQPIAIPGENPAPKPAALIPPAAPPVDPGEPPPYPLDEAPKFTPVSSIPSAASSIPVTPAPMPSPKGSPLFKPEGPITPPPSPKAGIQPLSAKAQAILLAKCVADAQDNYAYWYKEVLLKKSSSEGKSQRVQSEPGRFSGFFTKKRHGGKGQDEALKLRGAISDLAKENDGLRQIRDKINTVLKSSPYNRHSFASFLLDELVKKEVNYLQEANLDKIHSGKKNDLYVKKEVVALINEHYPLIKQGKEDKAEEASKLVK